MLENSPEQKENTTNLLHHLKKYHNKKWDERQTLRFHASLPVANAKRQRSAGSLLHDTAASSSSSLENFCSSNNNAVSL